MRSCLSVSLTIGVLALGACTHSSSVASSTLSPNRDPRVGLRAGWMDAGQAGVVHAERRDGLDHPEAHP